MGFISDALSLRDLTKFSFVNPKYHRSVVWDSKNVRALYNNFKDGYVKSKENSDKLECYIGTIILSEVSEGIFEIIDGYQRLSTIFLLFKVIRNHFMNYDNSNLINDLIDKINIFMYTIKKNKLETRIKHANNDDNSQFFESLLTGNQFNGSSTVVIERIKKLYGILDKKIEKFNKDELTTFVSYLLDNVKLVIIFIDNIVH